MPSLFIRSLTAFLSCNMEGKGKDMGLQSGLSCICQISPYPLESKAMF